MDDLIEALKIFRKYENARYPTGCSHDALHVYVSSNLVTASDAVRLGELGFFASDDGDGFTSYRFGSA